MLQGLLRLTILRELMRMAGGSSLSPPLGALALAACVGMGMIVLPSAGNSQTIRLEGEWNGAGSVAFGSGNRERARCRAHYRRQSANSYVLRATCATPSGRASQTATLYRVGENRYSGGFYNDEYGVSGRIYVVVRGSSQSVKLSSSSGSGSFRLSR
jgi:hypothetical protein